MKQKTWQNERSTYVKCSEQSLLMLRERLQMEFQAICERKKGKEVPAMITIPVKLE